VLFLGRLHPKKRLDLLIRAFLAGAPPTFRLVVAGPDEGGLWDRLMGEQLRNGVASRLVRVGTVGGADKVTLLAGARLFALPSEHENFGIAALEALAAGTPILLSPHVDLAAAAVDAGLVRTAPLDLEAWRQRFAALDEDASDEDSAQQARRWVSEHYTWDRIATELVECYGRVRAGTSNQTLVTNEPAVARPVS
jgi:glycosyltransferase involved in cell wall biosynthesis